MSRVSTLGDAGDLSAPVGSRPWAVAVRARFLLELSNLASLQHHLTNLRDALKRHDGWKSLTDSTGQPFTSWEAFCGAPKPYGLGMPTAAEAGCSIGVVNQVCSEMANLPSLNRPQRAAAEHARPVTPSRKRYVSVCAACDGLFEASRADQVTCSPACRVRLHRHPELVAHQRQMAAHMAVPLVLMLKAGAIRRLCPELEAPIMAGTLTIDAAQPQVCAAFRALLQARTTCPDNAGHSSADNGQDNPSPIGVVRRSCPKLDRKGNRRSDHAQADHL